MGVIMPIVPAMAVALRLALRMNVGDRLSINC